MQSGEEADECFIKHKQSGRKVMLQKKRVSYVLKVEFVRETKDEKGVVAWESLGVGAITVDSGAEESVCPLGWGATFGMKVVAPGRELKMINAGGGRMKHYGSRKVDFKASGF